MLCSTARRARDTWQLAEGEIGAQPPTSFQRAIYEASAGSLLDLVRRLPPAARTVVVVGHDPAVPDLALALARTDKGRGRRATPEGTAAPFDRMREKFPTAAIAVLEVDGPWSELAPGHARLTSFVTPRDMEPGMTR